MEMIQKMLAQMFSRGEVVLTLSPEMAEHLESKAIETLGRIRAILADDALDDPECFDRIERIVCELESIGIDCGARHDFG